MDTFTAGFLRMLQLNTAFASSGFLASFDFSNDFYLTQLEQANFTIEGPGGGLTIAPTGYIGIGTETPLTKMQIGNIWTFYDGYTNKIIGRNNHYTGNNFVRIEQGVASQISFSGGGDIVMQTATTGSAGSNITTWNTVTMKNNGDVGIGLSPTAKLDVAGSIKAASANISGLVSIGTSSSIINLDVKGKIRAEEVKVCLNQGCDYVFEEDYQLMSLNDLDTFIKTNKHLPDVAPAAVMEAEGINLSEMNALLLRKVEELTLYILQIEKRISEFENKKGGK
jgi:hypothetical protein